MEIFNYVKSLLPTFKKDDILEDIRITLNELKSFTIPAYQEAAKSSGQLVIRSDAIKNRVNIFNTIVKPQKKNDIVGTIFAGLQNNLTNLEEVQTRLESILTEDVVSSSMTYQKANLVYFAELSGFVSRYARRFLNYLYISETSLYDGQPGIDEALVPAEVKWIENYFDNFCYAFAVVSSDPKKLNKALGDIPEIEISKDNESVLSQTMGKEKINPMSANFVPVAINPFYHIGLMRAVWQTNRYHAAKREIKCLSLRKLQLERLIENKPDAKIQKEIDYLEDQIQGYIRKNAEMERKYG